mmetsp:Transcript_82460/g.130395  ORF Transcript_82460/g.130395 Transcript_82460/m.130395 type:complete len:106 (-) Transcript_82460:188-505(-)
MFTPALRVHRHSTSHNSCSADAEHHQLLPSMAAWMQKQIPDEISELPDYAKDRLNGQKQPGCATGDTDPVQLCFQGFHAKLQKVYTRDEAGPGATLVNGCVKLQL